MPSQLSYIVGVNRDGLVANFYRLMPTFAAE